MSIIHKSHLLQIQQYNILLSQEMGIYSIGPHKSPSKKLGILTEGLHTNQEVRKRMHNEGFGEWQAKGDFLPKYYRLAHNCK